MKSKTKKKPTPHELLAEVKGKGEAKTYQFEDYIEVIDEMQKKDYSYAQIAQFLQDRLGIAVNRGQVYRAYQLWLEFKEQEERERAEAEEEARRQGYLDEEPPSEEELKERAIASAAGDVIRYVADTYSGEKKPGTVLEIIERARLILDENARAEHEADEADKRRNRENNNQ